MSEQATNTISSNDDSVSPREMKAVYDRAQGLLHRQFRSFIYFGFGLMLAAIGVYAAVVIGLREPAGDDLSNQLRQSNEELKALAVELAALSLDSVRHAAAIGVIASQAASHRLAVVELNRERAQISPEGLTLIQLAGGTVVLAVLGLLGLQRMRNIDSLINDAREEINNAVRVRIAETRSALRDSVFSQVGERVREETERQFKQTSADMARITSKFQTETEKQDATFRSAAQKAQDEIRGVVQSVEGLLERYSWLDREDVREVADQFHEVAGVEEAAEVATRFRIAGDKPSAKLVLKRIGEHDLPGDSDDFHNAHSEAMRMDDPLLGVEIADVGLRHFPEHYDLMADKAIGLIGLGRANEAKNMLDHWRKNSPEEFARGWRPVVFYARAVQSGQLTPDIIASLEEALEDVASRLPTEVKVWSTYARFERDLGRHERAEEILRKGCDLNRYSQELNYVLGELLLQMGRADEALPVLESGLAMDYQDQYQHDVNQHAVRTTLAQAYEAVGNTDRAELLYRSVLNAGPTEAGHSIGQYATNRLAAISLSKGELPEQEETSQFGDIGDIMNFVSQFRKHETGSEDESGDIDDIVDV